MKKIMIMILMAISTLTMELMIFFRFSRSNTMHADVKFALNVFLILCRWRLLRLGDLNGLITAWLAFMAITLFSIQLRHNAFAEITKVHRGHYRNSLIPGWDGSKLCTFQTQLFCKLSNSRFLCMKCSKIILETKFCHRILLFLYPFAVKTIQDNRVSDS